jgi:lipopolysaccharide transport system ATP-binding protein
MAKPVIQVDNLSKAYQIGQIGSRTLSKDIDRFWQTKILGKEDPFLKIGETNDRSTKGGSNIVWSLKDINFEVSQGDAVGIIGKNGAGKSTLLKLLSRVTSPTKGEIKVKGRIASLLEVGTGFHPELSGRENIYLNGAILGMRKKEITRKLDEIIDFSGVERYVDTPVKRYSSGMYVRLAFAVAAHLESEILIVDEVLAVGDAEFQKKCLGKMGDISRGEGRTVLFVSHNMSAVQNLCNKGIVLENGGISLDGSINDVINKYLLDDINFNQSKIFYNQDCKELNGISKVEIIGSESFHNHNESIVIKINSYLPISDCFLGVALLNSHKSKIFTTVTKVDKKTKELICEIPENILLEGSYSIDVATFNGDLVYEYLGDICTFQVVDLVNDYKIYNGNIGDLKIDCKWLVN